MILGAQGEEAAPAPHANAGGLREEQDSVGQYIGQSAERGESAEERLVVKKSEGTGGYG